MFNYIKDKIDEKITKKFDEFSWDFDLITAANKAVAKSVDRHYTSSVVERLDLRIDARISELVGAKIAAEIKKPAFVTAVVSQLNRMQLNKKD